MNEAQKILGPCMENLSYSQAKKVRAIVKIRLKFQQGYTIHLQNYGKSKRSMQSVSNA